MTTYYVTKYALTEGILTTENAEVIDRYLYVTVGEYGGRTQVAPGYWHTTLVAAQAHVRELVTAKLKSLNKARAKYQAYVPKVREWK